MELKEFTIHYVKAKDAYKKDLITYEDQGECILFEFKSGEVPYFVNHDLQNIELSQLQMYTKKFIICLNKITNVEYLIKHWEEFSQEQGLIIMFANPELNEKWLINTAMHAQVTEPQDIEAGLMGLFSNIPSTK